MVMLMTLGGLFGCSYADEGLWAGAILGLARAQPSPWRVDTQVLFS